MISSLSGGQKKMVELAKLIVNQPDVLLLDEPDNHLDLAGKTYLEKFIRSYKGAVVLISHDRYCSIWWWMRLPKLRMGGWNLPWKLFGIYS